MARLLLTGVDGQVGFELLRSLAPLGEVIAVSRRECDLRDTAAIMRCVDAARPDVIINPAAWTAVDKAEAEAAAAFAVNCDAPAALATAASRHGALLVQFSTDYVFDGSLDRPYREEDACRPLSVYGTSKWEGEQAVRASGARHLILRTSWVYGAHGANFLKTVLRLAAERDSLSMVADQIGAPTSAALIADVTAQILGQHLRREEGIASGTYHLSARGETSWHGFACEIVRLAALLGWPLRIAADAVLPIPATAYPLPAPRPANSRLDTGHLRQDFGLCLPAWQDGVRHVMSLLAASRRIP